MGDFNSVVATVPSNVHTVGSTIAAMSSVNVKDASVAALSSVKNSAHTTNASFMTIITENVTNMMSQNRSQNEEMTLFNTTTLFLHSKEEALSWIMEVYLVVTVFVVILGLFGNIFTIIIMRKEPFRSNSYGIRLTALAVADMLNLILITLFKDSTIYYLQKDIISETDIACKIFIYLQGTTRAFTSWNVVFISVERFIAVWFPFKFKQLSSKRTTLIISGCFLIAAIIVAIFPTSTASVRIGVCSLDITGEATSILVAMLTTLYIIIPAIIVLFLTPLTAFKLANRLPSSSHINSDNGIEHLTSITVMLIGAVTCYIVLICSPFVARVVIRYIWTTPVESNFRLMNEIISITDQINCSINFFIYGLLCSEFRNQFIDICTSLFKTRTETTEQ